MKKTLLAGIAATLMAPLAFTDDAANPAADPPQTPENPVQTACDFLKKTGHYFLATDDNGQPRVRPFGTAAIFEGKLYIQTGRKKDVSKQIAANPKVEICAYDPASGEWLRIAATLVEDPRVEAKAFMLEQYPMLKNMYRADDENTQVLYLKDATATLYSHGAEPRVMAFGS